MASPRRAHPGLRTLFLVLCVVLPVTARAQVAVIVNNANPVVNLSLEQLRRLYLGTSTTFPGGGRVILIESPLLRARFYRTLLRMTEDQFKRHWMAVVFAGEGASPPREIAGSGDLRRFVGERRGALAFLLLADVDASVKVVAIGGFNPADAKYSLGAAIALDPRPARKP